VTVVDVDLAALDPDLERNGLAALVERRVRGRFSVDEWGLDRDLVRAVEPITRLRWNLRIEGDHQLPEIGPGLIVFTRRIGVSEPIVLTAAVARTTDRPLRCLGVPDRGPMAPLARRLGAVPGHPADVRSLLRAGELIGLPLGREILHPFHVGAVPVEPVAAAIAAGAPIIPVAVVGFEAGRWWTIRFGRPIATRRGRAEHDAGEMAEAARQRLQHLLTGARRPSR